MVTWPHTEKVTHIRTRQSFAYSGAQAGWLQLQSTSCQQSCQTTSWMWLRLHRHLRTVLLTVAPFHAVNFDSRMEGTIAFRHPQAGCNFDATGAAGESSDADKLRIGPTCQEGIPKVVDPHLTLRRWTLRLCTWLQTFQSALRCAEATTVQHPWKAAMCSQRFENTFCLLPAWPSWQRCRWKSCRALTHSKQPLFCFQASTLSRPVLVSVARHGRFGKNTWTLLAQA